MNIARFSPIEFIRLTNRGSFVANEKRFLPLPLLCGRIHSGQDTGAGSIEETATGKTRARFFSIINSYAPVWLNWLRQSAYSLQLAVVSWGLRCVPPASFWAACVSQGHCSHAAHVNVSARGYRPIR